MAATPSNLDDEFGIFAWRFIHFMNLWTIYTDLLQSTYVPALDNVNCPVGRTMMFIVYSYFYSLVEDSSDGVNGFRVSRQKFPEHAATIGAVEAKVKPFLNDMRVFRNRMGFHGSRSTSHESAAFALFKNNSGTDVFEAMKAFKAMGAAFLGLSAAEETDDHEGIAKNRGKLAEIALL
jgi:hypothetical protein